MGSQYLLCVSSYIKVKLANKYTNVFITDASGFLKKSLLLKVFRLYMTIIAFSDNRERFRSNLRV